MALKQIETATKGLRVINSIDSCVLKFNFLDYRLFIVPLQLPVKGYKSHSPLCFAYYAVAALVIVFVTIESSGGDEIVDPSLILQPPERCDYKDFLIA